MVGLGLGIGLGLGSNVAAGDEMPPRKITLIDGQFFKGLCADYGKIVGIDPFVLVDWPTVSSGAARTFYYDSLPAKRDNQTEADFQTEYQNKIVELDHIRSQKWFHVKDGVSRYRKKDKRREQKGVDILLAIDAVQMAAQGLADEITIFTSDTDFFPVFEMMNQTKCRGILRYQRGKTSDELVYAADETKPIELGELMRWCNHGVGHHSSVFPKFEDVGVVPNASAEFESRINAHDPFLVFNTKSGEFEFYRWSGKKWQKSSSANLHLAFAVAHHFLAYRYPYSRFSEYKGKNISILQQ